jgi:3-phenylpropionate/cinnamic acid dioxygenase small subunit
MNDLEGRIDRIEAQRAIEQLIYGYGHLLDFGDPDQYAAQFIEEGVIEIQSAFRNLFDTGTQPYEAEGHAAGAERTARGIAFRGRAALRRFVAKSRKPVRTMHIVSQPLVQLTGSNRASAQSYMRVYKQDLGGAIAIDGFGRYLDEVQLTAEGWRFSHRICEV